MAIQGMAEIDFGAFPGTDKVEVTVPDAAFVATMAAEAWVQPEATTTHTEDDILLWMSQGLVVSVPTSGKLTGSFKIVALAPNCEWMWGKVKVNWVAN